MSSLIHTHSDILRPGSGVIAGERVPATVPELLATYAKPTEKADKLQHHILQQAAKHTQHSLLAAFKTNAERAALLSASAPHAGVPLTCIPLDDRPSHYMPTPLFNQFVRMRLQLPPNDTHRLVCNVLQCSQRLRSEQDQVHHHHACQNMTRESIRRHNAVLNTVLHLAQDAGFEASKEEPVRDANGHNKRPDAILTSALPSLPILHIDVSIVHPAAASYSTQSASIKAPLSAAATREKLKHHKYDAVAAKEHARFIPLVMESYGAFGREFDSFLSSLASAAAVHNALNEGEMKRWMKDARWDIAMALQRGNAFMALRTCRAVGFAFESSN